MTIVNIRSLFRMEKKDEEMNRIRQSGNTGASYQSGVAGEFAGHSTFFGSPEIS